MNTNRTHRGRMAGTVGICGTAMMFFREGLARGAESGAASGGSAPAKALDPTSLDRLHDVIAPAPVPWWPPAPGWLWLLALLALAGLIVLLRWFVSWQRNRYRWEAVAEWKQQAARLQDSGQRAAALTAMSVLLKRVALTAYPRREVASLHGHAWLAFLDRTTATQAYSNEEGAVLERVVYDPRSAAAVDDACANRISGLVHDWIAHHRRDSVRRGEGAC